MSTVHVWLGRISWHNVMSLLVTTHADTAYCGDGWPSNWNLRCLHFATSRMRTLWAAVRFHFGVFCACARIAFSFSWSQPRTVDIGTRLVFSHKTRTRYYGSLATTQFGSCAWDEIAVVIVISVSAWIVLIIFPQSCEIQYSSWINRTARYVCYSREYWTN